MNAEDRDSRQPTGLTCKLELAAVCGGTLLNQQKDVIQPSDIQVLPQHEISDHGK